jgi:AcrR family transcriptional regulator
MGRPRVHDESTERELLAAAERLLAAGGAEAMSVRAVAEAAGATPRAIYSVFGSKEGLLRGLYREAFRALSAQIDAIPETDDPIADLVAVGAQAFRGWARSRPDLFRLAFSEAAPPGRTPLEAGVEAFDRLLARIRRCTQAGLIAPGRELEVGLSFHALCEGLTGLEGRGRFPLLQARDPEQVWRSALAALVDGYRA